MCIRDRGPASARSAGPLCLGASPGCLLARVPGVLRVDALAVPRRLVGARLAGLPGLAVRSRVRAGVVGIATGGALVGAGVVALAAEAALAAVPALATG